MTALPQPDQYETYAPKQSFDFGLPSATRSAPPREVRQFSLASSVRLQTIVENAPQIPEKSALRNSVGQASIVTMLMQHQEHQQQQQHILKLVSAPGSPHLVPRAPRASSDSASTRTVQPAAYSWMPDVRATSSYGNSGSNSGSISGSSMQNEKLAESLRQMHDETRQSRNRNRRRKVWLIVLLVLGCLLIVGLAVGLGVGLSSMMKHNQQQPDHAADATGAKSPLDGNVPLKYPLGHYRIVTSLKHRETACTSDPASWTCYADAGSDSGNLVMFDWVISATAPAFATSLTGTTAESGIPANLSISSNAISGADPFSGNMVFSNKSLTYISPTANDALSSSSPPITNSTMAIATGPRYTFNFVMTKLSSMNINNSSIPTTVRTPTKRDDGNAPPSSTSAAANSTTQCLNMSTTTLTAILYLSQPNTLLTSPKAVRDSSNSSPNSAPTWPYAVEILQSRDFDGSGPCYANVVSARDAKDDNNDGNGKCSCSWRNF
jgi:hypothetical protein